MAVQASLSNMAGEFCTTVVVVVGTAIVVAVVAAV